MNNVTLPWKSVEKDGLPENNSKVFFFDFYLKGYAGRYVDEKFYLEHRYKDWEDIDNVTHWLEITPPNTYGAPCCGNCAHWKNGAYGFEDLGKCQDLQLKTSESFNCSHHQYK